MAAPKDLASYICTMQLFQFPSLRHGLAVISMLFVAEATAKNAPCGADELRRQSLSADPTLTEAVWKRQQRLDA